VDNVIDKLRKLSDGCKASENKFHHFCKKHFCRYKYDFATCSTFL